MKEDSAAKPRHRALPEVDLRSPEGEHPAWVRREFEPYIAHTHATGPFSSTRELSAHGKTITIRTTYEVLLDGKPLPLHVMVDNDGRLWSHLCPYRTFATAPELVRYVLDHAPDALVGLVDDAPDHHAHGHGAHGHHGHGQGGHS